MDIKLFNSNKGEYGDDYNNHLFEQYKIYIQGIENISDRRHSAVNYFITINTALISTLGLSFGVGYLSSLLNFKLFISLIGLAVSIIFWHLINSYKQINTGKFKVLHEIESNLPLALYKYEWEVLEHGKNKKVYYPFSHVELLLPWLLGVVYFMLSFVFVFCN